MNDRTRAFAMVICPPTLLIVVRRVVSRSDPKRATASDETSDPSAPISTTSCTGWPFSAPGTSNMP